MEEDEEMEEDRNDEGRFIHRTFDRCTSLIAAKSGSRTVTAIPATANKQRQIGSGRPVRGPPRRALCHTTLS